MQLGHYQGVRCWDLTLTHMQGGQSVTVKCPSFYAYGSSDKYSHFGHEKIPANSDLTYEIEVLGCEERFETLKTKMTEQKIKLPRVMQVTDHFIDTEGEEEDPKEKVEDVAVIKKAKKDLKKMDKEVVAQEKELK
mmetsp:Transcript_29539/g.44997  ORF Transcript_29539/g.44997 Transcript_29539/m.44997 type:complete len:135 (+) Transcript_29539:460-864(+)